MHIIIHNHSPEPLYEQIARQLRDHILKGTLSAGGALPSIRFLAKELKVSIITTKRAYEELEADGFLQTVPGKGCFVSSAATERLREVAMCRMEQELSTIVDGAKAMGLTQESFAQIIDALWKT